MRLTAQQQQEGLALLGLRPDQLQAVLQQRSRSQAESALREVQNASARGLKAASLRYHPDRHENAPEPVRAENERLFKLANMVNQLVQDLAIQSRAPVARPVARRTVVRYPSTIHFHNTTSTTSNTTSFSGGVWRMRISFS